MDNNQSTPNGSALLSQADGRKLAAALLREFEDGRDRGGDDHAIEARYRQGMPQSDILARYLRVVREQGNPAIEAGFIAVLTDYLGSDDQPTPEFYEELDDADIERNFTAEERGD